MTELRAKWLVFLVPPVVLTALALLKLNAPLDYRALVQEDGLFETLQFLLFLGAGGVAILVARRLGTAGLNVHGWLYWLLGLGLVFVAMDEISWGQRLFGFETPDRVATVNQQNELTVHNLDPLMNYLHVAYLCVGAYGGFGWLINVIRPPEDRSIRRFVIADWYLSTYFASLLLVYGLIELAQHVQPVLFGHRLVIGDPIGFRDQESAELMLALAMAIFVLVSLRRAGSFARQRAAAA